jgi:N-methylhydantoinase A
LPTITDANLFLGRIPPERFLGGKMQLFPELAATAIETLAKELNLSPVRTALGIVEIANAHMERALRVISVERGYDPRDFTLLSFGGAGGLHAVDLARRLSIPRVLISPFASTLSAFGMLAANVTKDYTKTVMLPGNTPHNQVSSQVEPLIERGCRDIQAEGFATQDIEIEVSLDMRYRGQSYELTIPFTKDFSDQFHQEHLNTYGYQRLEAILEIVNLRVRAIGVVTPPKIKPQPISDTDPSPALIDHRPVVLGTESKLSIPFYSGESLNPGNILPGPAIIVREDTTILLPQKTQTEVDDLLNLVINA